MKFDFDQVIDRRNTNSLKYDFALERGKPADVLPLWVADMDFRTAPCVIRRLHQAVDHGIFGYSDSKEDYFRAVAGWYEQYYGWKVERSWMVKTPGVVFAIAAAVRAFTDPGDAVLIQQPVYYPFGETIRDNGRKLISNSLVLRDGHYEIDFEDMEEKLRENHVKLFLLCSPHNPVGRVWKEWELRRIGELCVKYNVIVVSDEIHSDFVYEGHRHLVFAGLDERFAERTITCTAPSKTFNLAGLQISNLFIPNQRLKHRLIHAIDEAGYSQVGGLGLAACQAAYEGGREWLEELKIYLKSNLDFMRDYIRDNLPGIRLIEPEGTYLIWLDFRELGLSEKERERRIVHDAKLWLDSGAIFGKDGEGFERINIACPRQTLENACERLKKII